MADTGTSTVDGDTEHLRASRPRIMNACVLHMRKRLSTLNSDFSRNDVKAVLRQKSVIFFSCKKSSWELFKELI